MKATPYCLIGVLALLMGYFSHQALNSSTKPNTLVLQGIENSSRTRSIQSHKRSAERSMGIPESTQRWLTIVALLEKATLDDIQGIAESTGFSDRRVTMMIGQHWFDLDPQHLFDASLEAIKRTPRGTSANFACYRFIELLAREWPSKDLEASVAAFSKPDPNNLLADYKNEFLSHLIKVDLSRAILLSKKWNRGLRDSYGHLKEVVKTDPTKAAHAILSSYQNAPTNIPQTEDPFSPQPLATQGGRLLDIVAEVWGASNPAGALAFAQSFKTLQGTYLQQRVLEQWARLDDDAAGHWLDQQTQDIQEKYRPTLIKAWATEDPLAALAWCRKHLKQPTTYQATVERLVQGALEGDLSKAASLLPELPDPNHKRTILRKVASTRFKPNDEGEIPPESIAWLRNMGNTPLAEQATIAASYNWSQYDPEGMKAYLEEDRGFIYPISLYDQLIQKLIASDPVSALDWTSGLARQSEGASHRAANHWLIHSPEKAITWLRESQDHTPSHKVMHKFLSSFMNNKDATDHMFPKLSPENKAWAIAQFQKK